MATAKERAARANRERSRLYEAHQKLHTAQARRRRRDNIIAGTVAGVIVLGAIGGQIAFYEVGPGAAADSTSTETPAPSDSPDAQ
ncbi:hypothetical protein [Microbacterium indicum]|uniref:hypothetical protein n=1 Tax=Microbacterium indicum TaxID=358100 RepID=UPI00042653D4|nr:hypothetical protein [Microbacterium indicum]